MRPRSCALAVLLAAASARADDAARIAELEQRVAQLEARAEAAESRARAAEGASAAPAEASREPWLTLSGSARFGWFDGEPHATTRDIGARVSDARLFADAELAEDVRLGDTLLVRNTGFTLEWNLVRGGELENELGEIYIDLQGIGGSSWLNLRPGRFQIPVGEAYKRYSRGTPSNPFITQPLGGPWYWDEGVMLYGASELGRVGYVASLTNGETPLTYDGGRGKQVSLKLWAQPFDWLYASVSGLHAGSTGRGGGSLWLGETWATPVGVLGDVPTWIDGAIEPPSYAPLDSTWLAAGDLILTPLDGLRLWLGGGHYALDSRGGSLYDRALHYWIAELILNGKLLAPELAPASLGLRVDGIGTGDPGRGYLLSYDYEDSLGYNMRRFSAYSAVLGWQLGSATTLRAEYSLRDIELVRGVDAALHRAARGVDAFAIELGVRF
jgi:hypothetical protein